VGEFATTPFGQRPQRSYTRGAAVLAGADLQRILRQAPIPPQQNQVLQQTGFGDMQNALASLNQMQQGLGFKLKDGLLGS
jgi:hypothetical protein